MFVITTVYGQNIKKCTDLECFWIITEDSINYSVKILGNVKTTENDKVIAVNDFALQYVVVDKELHTNGDTAMPDLKVLINYALNETEYLSKQFKTKLDVNMQKAPLSQDKNVLIWYYKMPENITAQVVMQLYANVIISDKIFGFASPQFNDQKFEDVRDFLMDIISTLQRSPNISELCNN